MTTIIFPGQGSQFVGMSKDFYQNFLESRKVFDLISNITEIDLKNIIFENPQDLLNQTRYTQLAIFCASMSIYEVLNDKLNSDKKGIDCMLGHSLGEYTALTAARKLSIEDSSLLLKKRGELMQNAYEPNKSGMAAIIGLNCIEVEKLIKTNNLKIEVANDNSSLQIVISGIIDDIKSYESLFKDAGAKKFVLLNVSAAFHSHLMIKAEFEMKKYIDKINFLESNIPIISNFNAKISNNTEEIIFSLSNQMSNRVRWVESIKTLEKFNEQNIIEV